VVERKWLFAGGETAFSRGYACYRRNIAAFFWCGGTEENQEMIWRCE